LTLRKKSGPDNRVVRAHGRGFDEAAALDISDLFGRYYDLATGIGERKENMAERTQNLQDLFLNSVRKSKTPLTIFLINGVKLTGVVTSFDNFCVLLRRDGHSQLVYKHAISTIMPSQPVQMFDAEENRDS
jgi:host factor-I protein